MTPELQSALRQSPRVVACDDDRLVLKLDEPGEMRLNARIGIATLIIVPIAVAAVAVSFIIPTLSRAGLLAIIVVVGAVVAQTMLFENTLVALRGAREITLERRNLLNGRKKRTSIVSFDSVLAFEVRNRVDLVSDVNPYEGFEVVARKARGIDPLWWSTSREVAEAVAAVLNDFRSAVTV